MSDAADAPRNGRQGHGNAWWIGIVSAVLLYVLSPPPLVWFYDHYGWRTPNWPKYVYAPLILLYDQFEPVKDFYDGYATLLGVRL